MDKYNYVILGSDWDLYKFSYSDLYQFNNVQYIPGPYPPINSLKGLLYRIHFNPTINRLVKLPFKTNFGTILISNIGFQFQNRSVSSYL